MICGVVFGEAPRVLLVHHRTIGTIPTHTHSEVHRMFLAVTLPPLPSQSIRSSSPHPKPLTSSLVKESSVGVQSVCPSARRCVRLCFFHSRLSTAISSFTRVRLGLALAKSEGTESGQCGVVSENDQKRRQVSFAVVKKGGEMGGRGVVPSGRSVLLVHHPTTSSISAPLSRLMLAFPIHHMIERQIASGMAKIGEQTSTPEPKLPLSGRL
ncbi:hypothetical protein BLNAU_421 [Blattamonas nauphoetae]|uniref:Uncharacterized protein n=1 Tax=Blattamonas nauphoetae TaxID=2049346 RepID=A0ABQ9YLH2_9EUKA|nr:hypothetical protein BLNAU_421 [Blattamonas nauphoetae]